MLAIERQEKIMFKLKQQKQATIEELCELTVASLSTLRRDLNDLEAEGKLRRVHGGAELVQELSKEPSLFEKSSKNIQAKEKIAEKAIRKIKNGDVIYLDAGSTTGFLTEKINQSSLKITIVTNSITHLLSIRNPNSTVYILGGQQKRTTDAVVGSQALLQLSSYHFNVAFLGANAYDEKIGAMTPDQEEAAVKTLAIKQSQKSFLLLDSSKISQTSFVKFASPDEVRLLTEREGNK
ncbi:MAG: DeoR/GlpR family DNA-binding transcription regulator [Streptococcaceae bacterium]|jgi:DeoR family fructose operon transcriptional repressor|nr:DeoR/GlpR family DNA-binding transcription regulator [Streptococcaceae bacterium]